MFFGILLWIGVVSFFLTLSRAALVVDRIL